MTATHDVTVVDAQIIADLRRDLDALAAQLAEERAQRTAMTEVLGVINASTGDLSPIFDAILDRATSLCRPALGMMWTYDGEQFLPAAVHGPTPFVEFYRNQKRLPPVPGSGLSRHVLGEDIVKSDDIADEPLYKAGNARRRAFVELGGARSAASLALRRGDKLVGAIQVYRQEVRPFSELETTLLSDFAAQAVIAMENAQLLGELRARTEELAQRNSEYGERIEQQAATIDVLKAMSGSPGDPQPVFDLIAERARAYCEADGVSVALLEGELLHLQAHRGLESVARDYEALFPLPVSMGSMFGRAILARDAVLVRDTQTDPDFSLKAPTTVVSRSGIAVPMLRAGTPIGAIALGRNRPGEFTTAQVELLQTFAEQAVIAINSAETYRALQTRTADLHESLDYQTATSDVLKVISRSTFDLQPVLKTLVETAARLCDADMAAIGRPDGDLWRMAASFGYPEDFEAYQRARGAYPLGPDSPTVAARAMHQRSPVHIHDVTLVPDYPEIFTKAGRQRTSLGVPLLRGGEAIGFIALARQRVEPFTERQIELVRTFADQAVIAIENTRLITEQREALEQQTATAEVLQVINSSPGNLAPVFDAILEKAHDLCGAAKGGLVMYDGEHFRVVATRDLSESYAQLLRQPHQTRPDSPLVQLLGGADHVHQVDLAEETHPTSRAAFELEGARTMLFVPLRREGTLLGYITAYRLEVQPFAERHISLLKNFAAQAVIAIENARLMNEQREALEQQTATAEVLQVINASPGNLAPVFDSMLEKAMRLCGAAFGSLVTYDGECFQVVATRGMATDLADALREREPVRPSPGMAYDRIARGADIVHIADVTDDDVYRSGNRIRRFFADQGGARTMLWVALRRDDVLHGVFAIYRTEVRPFSDRQVALLQNFAAQAVIAIDNARLLTEQREALEQQTATAEVLQVINASPGNLAPVFDAILEKAHRICNFDLGSLATYDGTFFRAVATRGYGDQAEVMARTPYRPLTTQRALLRGDRLVHIPDTQAYPVDADDTTIPAFVAASGFRACLMVPLQKDSTLLGFLTGYRKVPGPFSDKQITLLEGFAAQAVIAMENARLITEQREALEQQTATAEVLQVINASPGNLIPVFDVILEKAHTLCGAALGSLMLYESDYARAAAIHGFPEKHAALARQPFRPRGRIAGLIDGVRLIHTLDCKSEELQPDENISRSALESTDIRTGLWVPLRKDGALLGWISGFRLEVRPFSDKEIALIESFAAQAVIAMENARLLSEIRHRQDELRITFENMGDGVAMFDETHRLVAWNGKFQEIYDLPDVLLEQHRTYEEHLRFLAARGDFGADVNTAEQIGELVASTGQPYGYERTRPDGSVIEIRRNPVPDGGFVLIFSDITERKRSEAEIRAARDAAEAAYRELKAAQANLIQAEKMASLGQLTAGIAHEIKNPLNFVNNFAALSVDLLSELKETAAPAFAALTDNQRAEIEDVSSMLTSNLQKIAEHGQRADGIVKAMLEHSRGSSGERRTVDMNALIDEALNLAYHGARAQDQSFNITLERDFGEGIAPIEINPQDMTRVFLNIFSNGFYAATRRARNGGSAGFTPTLKVTTRDAGEALEIHVLDNGIGIPSDIRDKLFQPFFTTKPTGEGTGLGLSITYDIVTQQHGGSIAVDSKVGEYSEFTIRLPRNP